MDVQSNKYIGCLDGLHGLFIKGWCRALAAPEERVELEIVVDDKFIGFAIADKYRADLEQAEHGDGRHAFTFCLPAAALDGQSHRLAVRTKHDHFELRGSPINFRKEFPACMLEEHDLVRERGDILPAGTSIIDLPVSRIDLRYCTLYRDLHRTLASNPGFSSEEHFEKYGQHEDRPDPRKIEIEAPLVALEPAVHLFQHGEVVARDIRQTEAGIQLAVKAWAILAGRGDVEACITLFDIPLPTQVSIARMELDEFDVLLVDASARSSLPKGIGSEAIGLRLRNSAADLDLAGTPRCRNIASLTVENHPSGAVVHAIGWVLEAQMHSFRLFYSVGEAMEQVAVSPNLRGGGGGPHSPDGEHLPIYSWVARIDFSHFPPGLVEFRLVILWDGGPQIATFGPFSVSVPEPSRHLSSPASERRWLAHPFTFALLVEAWCDGASWLEAMAEWSCLGLFRSVDDLESAILTQRPNQVIVLLPCNATPPSAGALRAAIWSFLDGDQAYDLAVPAMVLEQTAYSGGRCVLVRWETLKSVAQHRTETLLRRLSDEPLVVLVEQHPLIVQLEQLSVGRSPREWIVARGWVSTIGPDPVAFELRTRSGSILLDVEVSKRPDVWKAHPDHSRALSGEFEIKVPWCKLPVGAASITLRCRANGTEEDVDLGPIATPPIIYGIESARKGIVKGRVRAHVTGWALAHDGSPVELTATDGRTLHAMELTRVAREDVVEQVGGEGASECGFAATVDPVALEMSRLSVIFRCMSGYVQSPTLELSVASVGLEYWVDDPTWSADRQTVSLAGFVASTAADVRWVALVSGGEVLEQAFPVLSTGGLHAPSAAQPMEAYCGFRVQADLSAFGGRSCTVRLVALVGDEEHLLKELDLSIPRRETFRRRAIQASLDFPSDGEAIPEATKLRVAGWAYSPNGHRIAVEVYSGTVLLAAEGTSLRRQDVGEDFRLPKGCTPGFDFTIEKELVPGEECVLHVVCRDLVTGARSDLGYRRVFGAAVNPMSGRRVRRWLEANAPNRRSRGDAIEAIRTWRMQPLISVLMPHYNAKAQWLDRALESLAAQWYRRFELCIADDGTPDPAARAGLEAAAATYPWTRLTFLPENQGISAATNAAAKLATGEYLLLLDQDDELAPNCLFEMVKRLNADPDLDVIYSDSDKIDVYGRRFDLTFKPGFDPDMLLSYMYMNHALLVRRALFDDVGGLRPGFEGAQDHDLALRLVERTDRIAHIPAVLYHWRMHSGSTALSGNEKPASFEAAARAIRDSLDRRKLAYTDVGRPDWAEKGGVGIYRVRWGLNEGPLVSIIIPTRNRKDLLERCIRSIEERSTYSRYEIVVVDDRSDEQETLGYLARLAHKVIAIDDVGQEFNFSALINAGVAASDGEFLIVLNNDTEVISSDWIEEMLGWAVQPGVGVVGCRLLFPGGHIVQHAGLVRRPEDRFVGHVFRGEPAYSGGYSGWARIARGVSGVTFAAAMIPRLVYTELSGLDETNFPVAYQDPDFCLRARRAGYRVVYTGHAELIHAESLSKPRKFKDVADKRRFWARWPEPDPLFNPNLALIGEAVAPTDRRVLLTAPDARVRVAALVHNLKRQGAPIVQLLILRELVTAHGFDVHVVVTGDGPLLSEYSAFARVVRMATGETLKENVAAWLGKLAPDVVYGNTLEAAWFIKLAIDEGFKPFWSIHESALPSAFFRDDPVRAETAERVLGEAGRIGFVAHATAELFRGGGLLLGPVTIIANGVDLEKFKPSHGERLWLEPLSRKSLPANAIIIGTAGTVCARKAQHLTIRAFVELQKANPKLPAWFVSVGEIPLEGHPYRTLLESIIGSSPRPERILMLPETAAMSEWYRCFDIFVSMSLEESFPMVVVEAMASGLPVIAADVFGVAEQVVDGTTGFTVATGDVAAMVERLQSLSSDVEARKALGAEGRRVAEKLFGMERMAAEYAREFRLLREQAG